MEGDGFDFQAAPDFWTLMQLITDGREGHKFQKITRDADNHCVIMRLWLERADLLRIPK